MTSSAPTSQMASTTTLRVRAGLKRGRQRCRTRRFILPHSMRLLARRWRRWQRWLATRVWQPARRLSQNVSRRSSQVTGKVTGRTRSAATWMAASIRLQRCFLRLPCGREKNLSRRRMRCFCNGRHITSRLTGVFGRSTIRLRCSIQSAITRDRYGLCSRDGRRLRSITRSGLWLDMPL